MDQRYLAHGAAGPDVVRLQRGLEALGHSCGRCGIDGFWGPATSGAVAEWKALSGRGRFSDITLDDLAELGPPRREDYDRCTCGACGIKWRFGFETTCHGGAAPPFEHDWRWFGRKVTIIGGDELVHAPVTLPSSANPLLEAICDPSISTPQLNAMWAKDAADAMEVQLAAMAAEGKVLMPSDVLRKLETLQGVPVGSLTWGETSWGSKSCDACGGKNGQHRRGCSA